MHFVALHGGREESLPSTGRENKWRDTEKKESTKRKACLKSYIRANENRGDSKVNEGSFE